MPLDQENVALLRSTANLQPLRERKEGVSPIAEWLGGPAWSHSNVEYRTWVGRYVFSDLQFSPHVTADGEALYHGEWGEVGAEAGHPHGL